MVPVACSVLGKSPPTWSSVLRATNSMTPMETRFPNVPVRGSLGMGYRIRSRTAARVRECPSCRWTCSDRMNRQINSAMIVIQSDDEWRHGHMWDELWRDCDGEQGHGAGRTECPGG